MVVRFAPRRIEAGQSSARLISLTARFARRTNTASMNTRHHSIACLLTAAAVLAGCQSPPTQRDTGMVIGGILGGVLGHEVGGGSGRTVATIVGTLIGASIGGAIGRSMDEQDRIKTAHTLESVRTGVARAMDQPGHRPPLRGDADAHLRRHDRPLPRIQPRCGDRRQDRKGSRHGVPAGRRQLAHGTLKRRTAPGRG